MSDTIIWISAVFTGAFGLFILWKAKKNAREDEAARTRDDGCPPTGS